MSLVNWIGVLILASPFIALIGVMAYHAGVTETAIVFASIFLLLVILGVGWFLATK